ncbi:LysR family transcriptional regulator [Granulicella sp. WH15]|uniref:LysR family transcriptional regulator n=1 Tax=Granulicella sp. WH15 TaxID=2602070 RepID=UPI0013676706|nr:LysR family transcriptional regulator [Granulicella sp. WH15]QHN03440.1 LysR family transcriptional regulator [Granulicella sp. WH15]
MEIHQLRYFCAVVETGSFTKAAEREGIAQPSLSQQIRRLEQSLGAELFVRQSRVIRLTHAGTVLYPYAQEILKQSKRASAQVRQLETDIRGPLRIGVIPTVLPYLVAPHLPEFSRQYPEVDVILTEDITSSLVQKLRTTDLDLIVVSLPLRDPDIVCSELMHDPLVLVTPENHRLISPQETRNFDLSGERLMLLKEGHCFRENMLTACKRNSAEMAPVFESDHFGSIFPLVAAGAGVTIAPLMAASHAAHCTISPLPKPQFRRIGYARLKTNATFKPLSAFIKWLRSVASERSKAM